MSGVSKVPPGFRFHPTDEELVDYYLRRKVGSGSIDLDVIKDVDLYKIEPWDLQELCRIGAEEQSEWYFFSHKDKKYPTGTRTNRATAAGFWKATGRDKSIYSKTELIGMRKTLVFYRGRAPNGLKSDWIMHEYRLESDENAPPQEEGWVVCRVFKKKPVAMQRSGDRYSPLWYDDGAALPEMEALNQKEQQSYPFLYSHTLAYTKKEVSFHHGYFPSTLDIHPPTTNFVENPNLDAGCSSFFPMNISQGSALHQGEEECEGLESLVFSENGEISDNHVTDWRVFDRFVASQLSQEETFGKNEGFQSGKKRQDTKVGDDGSASILPVNNSTENIEIT